VSLTIIHHPVLNVAYTIRLQASIARPNILVIGLMWNKIIPEIKSGNLGS
jgi:hypothetical protein